MVCPVGEGIYKESSPHLLAYHNYLYPPPLSLGSLVADEEEVDEDTEALLAADFEIGHFIRERVVPRAVLYFTGEALEDDEVSVIVCKIN